MTWNVLLILYPFLTSFNSETAESSEKVVESSSWAKKDMRYTGIITSQGLAISISKFETGLSIFPEWIGGSGNDETLNIAN